MRTLFFTVTLIFAPCVLAVTAEFEFNEQVSEQRYGNYIAKIRCLVCQNESLGSSRAELAIDLRRQIFKMMNDGQSNREISAYLIARYGDFILYQPPLKRSTLLLWATPFFLTAFLVYRLLARIKKMQHHSEPRLTDAQRSEARSILKSENKT